MSDPYILIGYIEEALPSYQSDRTFFRRANDTVIAGLPIDDSWPPLCRSLFSTTGPDALHGSFRDQRLIHFAGNFNYFSEELDPWLDKLESLLRRLYWIRAEIFLMNGWSTRPLCIRYQVLEDTVREYFAVSPRPPRGWEVSGFNVQLDDAASTDFVSSILARRALRTSNP